MSDEHDSLSVNDEADKMVQGILGAGESAAPVEDPKAMVDTGTKKTSKRLTGSKADKITKMAPPAPITSLPFELRKAFYVAVMYGDGRVTWEYDLGDAATNAKYGVASSKIVFRSMGGLEQQAVEAYMRRRITAGDVPATDVYLLLARRAVLLLQLQSYGDMTFALPEPDESGDYKDDDIDRCILQGLKKLGNAQLALAHKKLLQFEKDINICVDALADGSFMKAGQ